MKKRLQGKKSSQPQNSIKEAKIPCLEKDKYTFKCCEQSVPEVYEHLDHYLQKTTCAQRWQWLKQAWDFVYMIERRRKKGTLFVD